MNMSKKTYKYWFFYIKPEYLHLVCTEEEDSLLYAYTDNKEYAKVFKMDTDEAMQELNINKNNLFKLKKEIREEFIKVIDIVEAK